jgi:hypothetical protein
MLILGPQNDVPQNEGRWGEEQDWRKENDWWRPNDKSTTSQGLSFKSTSHMCFVPNEIDNKSESEDEEEHESDSEDKDDLQQFFAQLSKKIEWACSNSWKEQKNKKKCFISKKTSSLENWRLRKVDQRAWEAKVLSRWFGPKVWRHFNWAH